ncbi:MAG TPA: response regulator [Desulfotignum sp.]|nr:response regulator [Desulfotignum sp.]
MTTRNRRTVILISRPSDELHGIRQTLEQNRYAVHVVENIESLNQVLADVSADCVILDLDALDVDNPTIRKLTIQFPQIYFLCMSKNRFHPELKDAICYHIYACLTKPLDHDELRYWLRCIENDVASPE